LKQLTDDTLMSSSIKLFHRFITRLVSQSGFKSKG